MATSTLTDNTGTTGEVNITWTDSEKPSDFYAYRLYQRRTSDTDYTKIYETQDSLTNYSHDTYGWANTVEQEIILIIVSQDATTGALSESAYTGGNTFTPTGNTKYSLVHPTTPSLTVILGITVGDSFTEETESETIQLLDANGEGGGRKINVGADYGIAGTLRVQLREHTTYGTAAAQLAAIRALRADQSYVFLRDPFGGLTKIWFSSISIDRIAGVGTNELMDISFDYEEVT